MGYRFQHMPKLIMSGSFDHDDDFHSALTIVDDPFIRQKCAGSSVIHQWGDIGPQKNASLIHLIALGAHEATGPNRNGDSFKRAFLQRAHPSFIKHGALYRNHKNKDFSKRDGEIIKTAFNDDMDRVELLVSADHSKCADWLGKLEQGERVDFSMGFDCLYDICSICGNEAPTRKEYCEHVKKKAAAPYGMGKILPDGRKCYVDNPDGVFNDISKVPVGADMTAQSLRKVAGLEEEITGGAELAAEMFPELSREKFASKIAVAVKLSKMEKLLPMSASRLEVDDEKLDEKTAAALREMPAATMFGELAKLGCVLPFNAFFSLVLGDRTSEFEPYLGEAEKAAGRIFSHLEENDEVMDAVCAIGHYECGHVPFSKLGTLDSDLLQDHCGLHEGIAEQRMVKTAMTGSRRIEATSPASISKQAMGLLSHYAAYKLAALESGAFKLDDRIFYVAAALH